MLRLKLRRPGEVGRGFSVVATEIQKMAVNSAGIGGGNPGNDAWYARNAR